MKAVVVCAVAIAVAASGCLDGCIGMSVSWRDPRLCPIAMERPEADIWGGGHLPRVLLFEEAVEVDLDGEVVHLPPGCIYLGAIRYTPNSLTPPAAPNHEAGIEVQPVSTERAQVHMHLEPADDPDIISDVATAFLSRATDASLEEIRSVAASFATEVRRANETGAAMTAYAEVNATVNATLHHASDVILKLGRPTPTSPERADWVVELTQGFLILDAGGSTLQINAFGAYVERGGPTKGAAIRSVMRDLEAHDLPVPDRSAMSADCHM